MVKPSEAIELIGNELYKGFSISEEGVRKSYKQTYVNFRKGLDDKGKGVLVIGDLGVGKSAMMRVMQRLFKDTERRFRWVNAYELKDLSEGYNTSEIKEIYGSKADFKTDLYIDDIGVAVDIKRYGTTVNIITDIIMDRYDLFISSGYRTHLSSNLPAFLKSNPDNKPTIETVYGLRVLDRIKEMCELVTWKGESLRK